MIKAAVFSAILCSLTAGVPAQPAGAPQGAWLQDGTKWSRAPKEINDKLTSGRATILYFSPDHLFALIYATVNRVLGEYEVICNGCGQVVYSGTWEVVEKTVKVKYRLVTRSVPVTGEQLPGPLQEEAVKIEGTAVKFLGHSFHRSTELDANVREFIPPVVH